MLGRNKARGLSALLGAVLVCASGLTACVHAQNEYPSGEPDIVGSQGSTADSTGTQTELAVVSVGQEDGFSVEEATLLSSSVADAEVAAGLLRGAGADGFVTREESDEFNALYAPRAVSDPYFATAFAASFSPDDMARMALMFEQTPGNTMDEGAVSSFKISYGAVGASMMIGTGSVRTGASRMWDMWREHQSGVTINGESVQEWRRDYVEQVKQTGRSEIVATIEGDDRLGGLGYGFLGQAWGLAAELHPDLAWGEDFLVGEGSARPEPLGI